MANAQAAARSRTSHQVAQAAPQLPWCAQHPNYLARKKPGSQCEACWDQFNAAQGRLTHAERVALINRPLGTFRTYGGPVGAGTSIGGYPIPRDGGRRVPPCLPGSDEESGWDWF